MSSQCLSTSPRIRTLPFYLTDLSKTKLNSLPKTDLLGNEHTTVLGSWVPNIFCAGTVLVPICTNLTYLIPQHQYSNTSSKLDIPRDTEQDKGIFRGICSGE